MLDIVKRVLLCIFPALDSAALLSLHKEDGGASGVEDACSLRAMDDARPVLIYGFESRETVGRISEGLIDDAEGIYYVQLPADIDEIRGLVDRAGRYIPTCQGGQEHKAVRKYAVARIRAFKHTCDNMWMSMSSCAHRAKKAVEKDEGVMPAALRDLKLDLIKRLSEEYKNFEPMVTRLRIRDTDKVSLLFEEASDAVRKIEDGQLSPHEGVALAFMVFQKIRETADILDQIKEFSKDD